MSEHPSQNRFLGDAAVTDNPDGLNGGLLSEDCTGREYKQEQKKKPRKNGRDPQIAGDHVVLDEYPTDLSVGASYLHRAGILRRAQVLVRSMVRLHGKNMHTLTA